MEHEFNVLWKQEGATAADGVPTHAHLYVYTTETGVRKLTGIEHLPPTRCNSRGMTVGNDYFMGFPCRLGQGTGTCSTAGSTTVTLSGSYATTAYGMVAGYLILIEGEPDWLEIATVAPGSDATKLTLSSAATTTASGLSYCVAPRGGVKLDGSSARLTPMWVGIKAPATAASAEEADSDGSITSAVNGTYKFRYTYMNAAGRESQMSPEPTSGVAVTGNNSTKVTVTLTAISPTDAQVTKYRLYAEKDGSGNWNYVTGGDWTTTVVLTTDAELTLSGERAGPEKNDAPLFTCAGFGRWQRRVLGWGDPNHLNWLYFGEQGDEYAEGFPINLRTGEHWHVEFVNLPEIVTTYDQNGRLLVFGEDAVYTLLGHRYVTDAYNAPEKTDMTPARLCAGTGVGCVAADSLVDVNGAVWFLSRQGVYRMPGGQCPQKVTDGLDDIWARVSWSYAYLATAAFDLEHREYILSLPVDSATTNNLTLRINVDNHAAMLDDVGMQVVRRVKDDEVHVLSHTGVVLKWDTASTHKDGDYGYVGSVAAGCSTTNLVATGVFTSYTSSWGTLSGSPVVMLTGATAGEVSEILDVDDADGVELRTALSAAPAAGDLFCVGGIRAVYEWPWIRGDKGESGRKRRIHGMRLYLDEQTTGAHTEVAARGADSPGSATDWVKREVDTADAVEAYGGVGVWGKYLQCRVVSQWHDEHLVVTGLGAEVSG